MDKKIKIMLVLIFLLGLLFSSIALASTLAYYGRIVGTITVIK